jgi:uncharacterized membrane protein YecN with MAPEG domain
MGFQIVSTAYIAIAAFVMVSVFFGGVVHRRPIRLFTPGDQTLVVLACLAVALLWVVFIPGLAVVGARHLRAGDLSNRVRWLLHSRAARARG